MSDFLSSIESVNKTINTFVWEKMGLFILIGAGILLTLFTKFFQVTHPAHWWKNTIGTVFKKNSSSVKNNDKRAISQFQSLCTALAATIGTGNIAGVSAAIVVGGPGAVFWMWIAAFLGMMTNFSENVLGIFYRRRNDKGEWSGGAMYYLSDGLGSKKGMKSTSKVLAVLFAVFAILASFGIGNMSQVNKITLNLSSAFFSEVDLGIIGSDSDAHVSFDTDALFKEDTVVFTANYTATEGASVDKDDFTFPIWSLSGADEKIASQADKDAEKPHLSFVSSKPAADSSEVADKTYKVVVTENEDGSYTVTATAPAGVDSGELIVAVSDDLAIVPESLVSVSDAKTDENYEYGGVPVINIIIGAILVVLGGLIILGGLQRIASFAERVIPVMAILYVIGCLTVFFVNIDIAGDIFSSIFRFAFGAKAVAGGAIGTVIVQGCKRGVFSNEAGLGSSVMVHSSSNVKEPVRQGMWGIFEVFFDTFVVCTMTAFVVLSSGFINLQTGAAAKGIDDATLVSQAFGGVFGSAGEMFVAIAMLFFAFTTVLGWSQYGAKAVEYLFGTKGASVYKVIFVLMIISGAVMTSGLAWDISDTFNGLMMIPNLIAVIALAPLVAKITKNYVDRRIKGKNEKPMLSYDENIQKEMEKALKESDD